MGGVASGLVLGPPDVSTAEGRGRAFGQGLVQVVLIAAGVLMIAIHLLKRGKKP